MQSGRRGDVEDQETAAVLIEVLVANLIKRRSKVQSGRLTLASARLRAVGWLWLHGSATWSLGLYCLSSGAGSSEDSGRGSGEACVRSQMRFSGLSMAGKCYLYLQDCRWQMACVVAVPRGGKSREASWIAVLGKVFWAIPTLRLGLIANYR